MSSFATLQPPTSSWQAEVTTQYAERPTPTVVVPELYQKSPHANNETNSPASALSKESGTCLILASTEASLLKAEHFQHLDRYIAVGCLQFDDQFPSINGPRLEGVWVEMLALSYEVKLVIGNEAARLLDARWVRLFLHQPNQSAPDLYSTIRVYILPEDWNRTHIDRNTKSLKKALHHLLGQVDTSLGAWTGNRQEARVHPFDPWASAEDVSLYYLFNKLPSPSPNLAAIRCRYSRKAVQRLLESTAHSDWEAGEQPLAGLRTRLYPYQARSAGLMLQRESAPQLLLDPRLEVRRSPNGKTFYYSARDGSVFSEARYYEANRGGILAETMGLGKTLMCLAVILATKGHYSQIPAAYLPGPPIRSRVGRLTDMAAATIGRRSIPARSIIIQAELDDNLSYVQLKDVLDQNVPFYEIPPDLPRLNRNTKVAPPRQLVLCSGTIIVVPGNLLHQWQSEIQKHVIEGGLSVLVVDSPPKGGSKAQRSKQDTETMTFVSKLPAPTELMKFDVVLFTRGRFENEIDDGTDEQGRRITAGVARVCACPYIGATRIPNCNCVKAGKLYESPLKKLHWLRIIIDEGHTFSSPSSNAVLVAKQIHAERRWVVSGTPAKNLVGVELEMATLEDDSIDATAHRDSTIEQRKEFNVHDVDSAKSAKALGLLASHFLMVRPWCESTAEGRLDWDEYIYRHEDHHKKTYSGFSSCFLRTLEGLVVKTRPEDVERDIVLPPMTHRVVYLKPCWYDKMTANMFVQVLRANAITSERSDVDYLFHKNSTKARHTLIKNLRQSNFTWTAFRLEDVINTLETTENYISKDDKNCSQQDIDALVESSNTVSRLVNSAEWIALSRAHEVGMTVEDWPEDSEESFSLAYPTKPAMVGITQLLQGQLHVDSHIMSKDPAEHLKAVGQVARAQMEALVDVENATKVEKAGVPLSCVGEQPALTSLRASKASPQNMGKNEAPTEVVPASPVRPKKRKLTLAEEQAGLSADSPLRHTRVVATTSAKLTYLLDKVVEHQATEKIIIFYDGDNAAFYIAQCLEVLYINYRIYARTLSNLKRSEYVAIFNSDPDVRVLLIDVACGALGLNLNAASIVLIVNPINRPSIEAQAIKRAHRIGQDKKVTVETLVLENTIEHAIFNHAKKMSRAQHLEAKELEDDAGIVEILQNAQILPISPEEEAGHGMSAKLKVPQQVFGRPNRHKFHRYGTVETNPQNTPRKKAKTSSNSAKATSAGGKNKTKSVDEPRAVGTQMPVNVMSGSGFNTPSHSSQLNGVNATPPIKSIFGNGPMSN